MDSSAEYYAVTEKLRSLGKVGTFWVDGTVDNIASQQSFVKWADCQPGEDVVLFTIHCLNIPS